MTIDVVCAVIQNEKNEYLCVQRGFGALSGKWEFPGGKIEPGETAHDACSRELKEELDVFAQAGETLFEHMFHADKKRFRLIFLKTEILSGVIELKEHKQLLWLKASELVQLDWLDGDWPMVERLSSF